ncbi:MAG: hypothetical protein AAGJ70_10990 [Pseudomonadota bacterium]
MAVAAWRILIAHPKLALLPAIGLIGVFGIIGCSFGIGVAFVGPISFFEGSQITL